MAGRYDGTIKINTQVDTSGIKKGAAEINTIMGRITDAVKGVGKAIAAAFAIQKIAQFSKECIDLGSDLEEVQNVVDVTFGEMSSVIDDFAKNAATQFGMSELSAKQYSSTIGAMLKSMGFAGDAVTDMSMKMTGLVGDMASFYNLDTDTAFQKIRSGISGETEPLKQLGINLSEANLEQFRLAQGMTTAYSKMSQQEKALVRYNYLLSVTSDAQGDFARTSSSWANQTRILSLQFQQIKADIGQGLINAFLPLIRMVNALLQGLAKLASSFKAFTALITGQQSSSSNVASIAQDYEDGAAAAEDYAAATQQAAAATEKAAKAASDYESPLDHINRYQKEQKESSTAVAPVSGGSGAAAAAASVPIDFGSLEKGDTVIDKTAQKMKDLFDSIVKGCKPAIDAFKDLYENALKPFGERVGEGLAWFWENVLKPLAKWTISEVVPRFLTTLSKVIKILNAVIDALKPSFKWFWDNVLKPLATWTGKVFLAAWDAINNVLEKFANWCKEHPGAIRTITTVVLSFFAAFEIVKIVTGIIEFIKGLGGVITAIKAIGALIGGVLNPWVLAIGAVIAIGVLLWQNWDTIKAKAKEIWGKISDYLKRTWNTIKTNAQKIWNGVKTVITKVWTGLKTAASTIWNGTKTVITKVWTGLKTAASTIWNGVKTVITKVWTGLKTAASTIWNGTKTLIVNVWNGLKTAASTIWNGTKTVITKVWTGLKTAASTIWNGTKTVITKVWTGLKSAAGTIWNGTKTLIVNVWNGLKTAASTIWNGTKTVITKVWTGLKTAASTIWNGTKTLIVNVWNGLKTAAGAIWTGTRNAIVTIWNGMQSTASTIWNGTRNVIIKIWNSLSRAAGTVWNGISSFIQKTWNGLKTKAGTAWNSIKTTIGNTWTGVKSTASSAWSGITSTLTSAWSGLQTKAGSAFRNIASTANSAWSGVRSTAGNVWTGLSSQITGVFSKIGSSANSLRTIIPNALGAAFRQVVQIVKTPINGLISAVNGMIRGIVSGINAMIGALNRLKFSIPSWVPVMGGRSFGLNIPRITSYPQIPRLAQGAVIPPNAPFAAVLGDQKSGNNLELPESLLRRVIREETGAGSNGNNRITIMLDRRVLFDGIIKEGKLRQGASARNPFELA